MKIAQHKCKEIEKILVFPSGKDLKYISTTTAPVYVQFVLDKMVWQLSKSINESILDKMSQTLHDNCCKETHYFSGGRNCNCLLFC